MDNPPEVTPSSALPSGIKGLSPMMERINPLTVLRAPAAPFLPGTPALRNAAMSSPPSDAGAALPMAMEADLELPLARQTPPRPDGFIGPNSDSRANPNLSRRREKPQLSCHLCRRRKLRCDRQHPCSSCASRGVPCTYADSPTAAGSLPKSAAMYDRIVQLERLVMSLVPGSGSSPAAGLAQNPSAPPMHAPDLPSAVGSEPSQISRTIVSPVEMASSSIDAPTPVDVRSECGSMRMTASELRYVGGDHWAAILDNIADLKDHFDREEQFHLTQHDHDNIEGDAPHNYLAGFRSGHALLLYGCPLPASRAEIIAALPPKSAVDRYISRYFNRLDLVHSIVHGPTFLGQYEAFWADTTSVPILWVGLLFSMICLALLASDASDTAHGDPEHRTLQVEVYREKTVQCLLVGEYTKSGLYVLETVIHYVYIELGIRGDADKDIWFLFALEVNLAMRMGYHRDPSHFSGISPLHSEMRRRLWATVLQGDILVSSQMGMPRMICDWKYDTAEPRNLNDGDLSENMSELPPPRPETELTSALGIIARRRMFVALGAISDVTAAIQPCSYAEIMRVDGILREAAAGIPPPLQSKPMASSMTDAPEVIMARLFLAHLFYKGQIMLHRRFLYLESTSHTEDVFVYSRKACLDATVGALQIQNILDEETCPGGQLHMMRWRVSSIMNHTFLTATMVLCSALYRGQTLQRDEEILRALRRTRTVWMRASSSSREAKKAAETVSIVIARAAEHHGPVGAPLGDPSSAHGGGPGWVTASSPVSPGGQDLLLQDNNTSMGNTSSVFEPDRFVMPSLMGAFTPPDAQGQTFNFNTGPPTTENLGVALDEWIQMNNGPTTSLSW